MPIDVLIEPLHMDIARTRIDQVIADFARVSDLLQFEQAAGLSDPRIDIAWIERCGHALALQCALWPATSVVHGSKGFLQVRVGGADAGKGFKFALRLRQVLSLRQRRCVSTVDFIAPIVARGIACAWVLDPRRLLLAHALQQGVRRGKPGARESPALASQFDAFAARVAIGDKRSG